MWINVLVGAICGAVAAMVGHLVVSKLTSNKNAVSIATIVLMVVLFGISKATFVPYINTWSELRSVEEELSNNVAFSALKEHDAAEYDRIIAGLKEVIEGGGTQQDAAQAVRGRIEQVVKQRLPIASDAAVSQYMRAMVKEMKELKAKDPALCQQFLFPEPGKNIDLQKHVSAETLSEDLAGLASVVRSSATSPTTPSTEAEVSDDLTTVMMNLYEIYGEDILALENPAAAHIPSERLCQITIDMYDRVLALPDEKSGPLLRYLLNQA